MWKLEDEPPQIQDRVRASGLLNSIDHSYGWMDMASISAFVERWKLETNTFHIPFREMIITPDDVMQTL